MKFMPNRLLIRLTLLGSIGALISIFALGSYIAYVQREQALNEILLEANMLATGLANAIAPILVVRDYGNVDLTAMQYTAHPKLTGLSITNANGQIIYQTKLDPYSKQFNIMHSGMLTLPTKQSVQAEIVDALIISWQPINAGKNIGWVQVELSLAQINARQAQIIMTSIVVAICAALFSCLVLALALKKTIKELRAAAKFASSLPEKQGRTLQNSLSSLEIEMLVSALNRASKELYVQDENIKLAAMVYQASSEAMLVTDAHNHIIDINPAFTQMTGYSLAEIVGTDSQFLSSGLQDTHFYNDMWEKLNEKGVWQGEVWSRRKNGEIFAESLTINTIYHEDGTVHRRVALFSDISEKKKTDEIIWEQANFDHLTQLPNRSMVYNRLDQEIKKSHRTGLPLAIMFVDLDRFKEVNDSLGHEAGDSLLKEASKRMLGCVRESDTVGRLGGDEFTVFLSELEDIDSVGRVAANILNALSIPYQLGDQLTYTSASIGITIYPDDATDISTLLKNADQAMYAAKHRGRNCYNYFTLAMQEAANARMDVLNGLHDALLKNHFKMYYQPIVNLATNNIEKAEALIRWHHPGKGIISPHDFISVAEETGLIGEIGAWVFNEVAVQSKHWQTIYHPQFQISINQSPLEFKDYPHKLDKWFVFMDKLGLSGQNIVIEITEGILMEASDEICNTFLALRDKGIQVALDDFGTGYSAMAYLKKFDIDYIKIDQSFVRNLAPQSDDHALCEAMIVMAHKLGIKVIAEGVETVQQLQLLKDINCDYGQGYLWSPPVTSKVFESLLVNRQ
ncbi:EAL domain-containing protein [Methylomonas sp. AM2-LC]|uniref:putative bifunctional diguanylate cyclase/phosphodiesterase n=1 Tax=Methylomonas sp. AM2-LC TaxID=3153301 RepID=UPI003266C480